uniref:Heme oxygenase n=1 Tax=Magnetococcus massalia (strain MO-1) TaxID=451514 RepID=A0A1S7LDI4_MAGMO|nr:conserved protein of unknown function [Candidatus Magnetococcus massalia]
MGHFPLGRILPLKEQLDRHPVYGKVKDARSLRLFMQHHVFSVWDFMSLLKSLQHHIAPSSQLWTPQPNPHFARFINEIVVEEECDEALPGPRGETRYASHYQLYLEAMEEVEADTQPVRQFVEQVKREGVHTFLKQAALPPAARSFMQSTFGFIQSGKPHVVAAAFALGREHIIPPMFRALLKEMQITQQQAPVFHYYLTRHIDLDGDHHGPLSMQLLTELCGGDKTKIQEAEDAAIQAIQARIIFWYGVGDSLT